ncbi:hypothetical protein [Streptomyces albipurpureus]|uniref:Lipoprotein n=1 Tax=Streptomyces albipurpureus TaxID=2897419 RepID=A0ABT0UQW3_9ACTN|nr:hypothetical protein [Streptomyces sp. CWNU-1]MCM2390988.1 hypothetical protein [Streptomyces sp. CWNU-1]
MRQRVMRMAMAAGACTVALLLALTMCGGDNRSAAKNSSRTTAPPSPPPPTQLTVPAGYGPRPHWEVSDASPEQAFARVGGRMAYLERMPGGRFRMRTLDVTTGRPGWTGRPWHPPTGLDRSASEGSAASAGSGAPPRFPRLLGVAKDGREFFVAWSFGRAGDDRLAEADTFLVLDIYGARDGARRRVELPWTGAPTVSGTGPGVLITDGRTRNAVVDPMSGEVVKLAENALAYPKGCAGCRRLTEIRAITTQGLLLSGESGFWVRGGWYSGKVAPSGTNPASGTPTSVAPGLLLSRWQPAKKRKDVRTHEVWAVHDITSGKLLVQTRCHKPAIEPGEYPQAAISPKAGYLVAGHLAFDLTRRKAYCFEQPDGSQRLLLTTVTDSGTAYGATGVRGAAEALAGGGTPVQLELTRPVPQPLAPQVRLPQAEVAGVGIFGWTDARDRLHLLGHVRRTP